MHTQTDETHPAIDPAKIYDAENLARVIGVSSETVRRWHRNGILPGKQLGRSVRWRGVDVLKHLASERAA